MLSFAGNNRCPVQTIVPVIVLLFVSSPVGALPSKENIEQAVEQVMSGRTGALVVVDVASDAVVAAYRLDLAGHELERPGSTVKPFVLAALLDSGKLDPDQKFLCKHALRIGNVQMDCSHPAFVNELNAEDAIAYSCNSYFAQVSIRLSDVDLVEAFRRAGFNAPTGLVGNEAVGRIERPTDQVELQLEALGDRGIEVTPLELAEAYRKLALRKREGNIGVYGPVYEGLEQSVAYGMAHGASVGGMRIAGKTGTASSPRGARTHGFFVGYAPADKPEIVVVVLLKQGRGMDAAAVAQPVFAEYAREKHSQ
jgi:cell division protein FtsI/penicillin-binding protein 2